MKGTPLAVAAIAAAILGLACQPAFAQTRVFVSGGGDDTNPCSLSEPCRTFQQAHNTVAAGGEIVALDSAGYGPLIISKSVTVTAIGVAASITASGTFPALAINAGPSDVVAVRGLTLFSNGTLGVTGLLINNAKSVTVRDCWISGFPDGVGILVTQSGPINVELRNVTAIDNAVGFQFASAFSSTLLFTDSQFNGNSWGGIYVAGAINATFDNVTAAANGGKGIWVNNGGNGGPQNPRIVVMVTGSKLVNNATAGLSATSDHNQVFVDRTQISGNGGNGWEAFNAMVTSYRNNAVNGNGNDGLNGVFQMTGE